ncbi:hypothetical protein F5887DRAFT_292591 [Amanita rubescens]|nr:hypothetical protein F5887DRAFT_292591 [Amanita rubescens]
MGQYDPIGVLLVGIFFNTYLFGLVSFQFLTYYGSGYKDPLWIRVMVFIMFATDTFHSASLIRLAWIYCVTNFGNPDQLLHTSWVYSLTPLLTGIAAFITHMFLSHRIYCLTQSRILSGFICVLAMTVFVMASVVGIKACLIPLMSELVVLDRLVTAWVSLQVGVDFLIAAVILVKLYFSRTRFRQTNTVINRLMRMAIQSGTFATIFAIGDMVTFLLIPELNLYGMFTFPIGRIYTNTLMYTLNMRMGLRNLLDEPRSVGTFSVPFTTSTSLSKEIPVEGTVHGRSSFSLVMRKDIESGLTSSDGKLTGT